MLFWLIVAVYRKKDMKWVITLWGKMHSQFGVKTNVHYSQALLRRVKLKF